MSLPKNPGFPGVKPAVATDDFPALPKKAEQLLLPDEARTAREARIRSRTCSSSSTSSPT